MRAREQVGREASPRAGVIDSQCMKTSESGDVCGCDAGNRVKGRKRRIVTDALDLIVGVIIRAADIQDRDGAPDVLNSIRARWPWLRHVFADGGLGRGLAARRARRQGTMDPRHRQALRRGEELRGSAPPMTRRAHLRVARTLPTTQQGLGGNRRIRDRIPTDRPYPSAHQTHRKGSPCLKELRVRLFQKKRPSVSPA